MAKSRIAFRPSTRSPLLVAATIFCIHGVAAPVGGHEHTAPWLNESSLDGGLYVDIGHPSVIRNREYFDVSVVLNNLLDEHDVVVTEVRYRLPRAFDVVRHRRRHVLASKRSHYREYKRARRELRAATERRDRRSATRLYFRSRSYLSHIGYRAFRDRQRVAASYIPDVGSTLEISVEVDVVRGGQLRTLERQIAIPVQPPLPTGTDGSWFSGDQHLHTVFSIDAFLFNGTVDLPSGYAAAARTLGLDWIIITDHANVNFLFWYRPWMFAAGEKNAESFRINQDYLVLQGQEMGVGAHGTFGEPAHLLVYPYTVDSTGYLPNPCPGLIVNHVNCEPANVILDRVNENGGIGFIAHPFDAFVLSFAAWDTENDTEGWGGVEIVNSSSGALSTETSIEWWHELLDEIEPPQDGELAPRPDFPTRFPVAIGNSDAHRPGDIGNAFTYARLPEAARGGIVPREDVMAALTGGRAVASNGPLVFGEAHGAGIGEVAMLLPNDNEISVTLQTTSEFGSAGDYTLTVMVDGATRIVVPPSGAPGFERTVVLQDLLSPPDKFVTLRAECAACSGSRTLYAISNPIWLEFVPPAPSF